MKTFSASTADVCVADESSQPRDGEEAPRRRTRFLSGGLLVGLLGLGIVPSSHVARAGAEDRGPFIPAETMTSTVPPNGDLNPYGVAFVPPGFRSNLVNPGDILVSNFNNAQNLSGTGTTIVSVTPGGVQSLFATVTATGPHAGLTGALGILRSGFVLVGSLPTTDGTFATIEPGALVVFDARGSFVQAFTEQGFLDSPWGLALHEKSNRVYVFVSNVVSGNVVRFELSEQRGRLHLSHEHTIGHFPSGPNDAALFLGPGGLVYDDDLDILYVASSFSNEIFAIDDAEHRTSPPSTAPPQVIFPSTNVHLHGPVGLVGTPNGHLITANTDPPPPPFNNADPTQPSELVELTKSGQFVGQLSVDPNNGGAFGLAIGPSELGGDFFRLAAVDDNAGVPDTTGTLTPGLKVFTLRGPCGR